MYCDNRGMLFKHEILKYLSIQYSKQNSKVNLEKFRIKEATKRELDRTRNKIILFKNKEVICWRY